MRKSSNEHYRYWHEFAERRLFGIEIGNDEIFRVSLDEHDPLAIDGHTNILGFDALEKLAAIKAESRRRSRKTLLKAVSQIRFKEMNDLEDSLIENVKKHYKLGNWIRGLVRPTSGSHFRANGAWPRRLGFCEVP